WATEYGLVFSLPCVVDEPKTIVLMDPKAIVHFYARGEAGYTRTKASRDSSTRLVLRIWYHQDRKSLSPSFSPAIIRGITPLFFEIGYKVPKVAWDSQLDASCEDFVIIEVQIWYESHFLGHQILFFRLDSIGMGGFSRDFGIVEGKHPLIA
ncbi:hypothetical protein C8J56DRAFT_729439, partial [Mycena floridula]